MSEPWRGVTPEIIWTTWRKLEYPEAKRMRAFLRSRGVITTHIKFPNWSIWMVTNIGVPMFATQFSPREAYVAPEFAKAYGRFFK